MSDYDFVASSGKLKLKGVAEGGVKKKKSSSSKSQSKSQVQRITESDGPSGSSDRKAGESAASSSRASPGEGTLSVSDSKKTDAERRFEEIQRERLAKRVSKLAKKTHKERVNEFNNKLEALSEHHDIPKVGPG